MRHTKIVATVGPACDTDAQLDALIAAGVDVFRLNFSHGSHQAHAQVVARVRAAAERSGRVVAILQDLSGPKIRTGSLVGGVAVRLDDGATLRIATGDFAGTAERVSTTYAPLARSVKGGDRLLLDDGKIELTVERTDGDEIVATVLNGGDLGQHKGISAPGVTLPASSLTGKDLVDLQFGIAHGVDFVALSFVQSASDVTRLREAAAGFGAPHLPVIAKIERPEAVAAIDEVLDVSDGVMVARGDLGLEMPLERVPRIQKEITHGALLRGIPVIVATQVFESMRTEPRPTRAEVSDAANAVDDRADAIMLSGETAVGVNPRRTVQTLDAVIRDAEGMRRRGIVASERVIPLAHSRALCEAAVTLARVAQAKAIVAVTRQGRTARVLSAFRPPIPIFAAVTDPGLARRLVLHRGVTPILMPDLTLATISSDVESELLARGSITAGDAVVFVSVNAELTRPGANFLRIHQVQC